MLTKLRKHTPIMSADKGFTLIEIMIVVAIIGILGAVSMQMYSKYVEEAKCSRVINAAQDILMVLNGDKNEDGQMNIGAGPQATVPNTGYATTYTIDGQTINAPSGTQVAFSWAGTSNDILVSAQTTEAGVTCPKGSGANVTYRWNKTCTGDPQAIDANCGWNP